MNTHNILKIRLLAMAVLCVAVLVPVSVSAQKPQKEPKKQTEQTVKEPKGQKEPKEPKAESGKQKEAKEPKEPKAESGKQKEAKEPKEPKIESEKQTEQAEQTEQKSESKKQKGQKPVDETLIATEEIPVAVIKAYKKRYASASDPVWRFYKEEQLYKVNCVYRNVPSLISFNDEGIWVETTEEHPVEKLSSACIKTINMYYQDYKINSLKKVLTSSKNDMFIVGLFESQNIKKKIETIVYLETSGAYIRADDPALNEDIPVQMEQVDKKPSKEDKKMEKEFGKDAQMDDAPVKLSGNELPPSIQKWVSRNYPEYIYKDIAYGEYDDFEAEGNIYQIVIQRNGINQPHATVWFTRNGDFLKLEDNFREDIQIIDPSKEVKTAKETDKKNTKEVTKTDDDMSISVEEEEVKAEIVTAFKTKYPRAKNVSWAENERDGEWIVSFTDQYGQNTATFSDYSNEWMYTKTLLPDVNKIPAAVRNYIEKNYPKRQITKGWVIKSPDAKPYYTVEVYFKKTREYEQLDFLQNGKPKS